MEILEAFDLTHCAHSAAQLGDRSRPHHTGTAHSVALAGETEAVFTASWIGVEGLSPRPVR